MVTVEREYTWWGRVRLERHVTEPEWDEDQRALMLALTEYRRLLCPCGCGHLAEESQAITNDGRFRAERFRCHARTAISKTAATVTADAPEALLWRAYLPDEEGD